MQLPDAAPKQRNNNFSCLGNYRECLAAIAGAAMFVVASLLASR